MQLSLSKVRYESYRDQQVMCHIQTSSVAIDLLCGDLPPEIAQPIPAQLNGAYLNMVANKMQTTPTSAKNASCIRNGFRFLVQQSYRCVIVMEKGDLSVPKFIL